MGSGGYDLITVGGGLGGSSLAWAMARHGAKVLVLEREHQFKDRVRGEAVTSWGVAEAKTLGIYDLLLGTCGHELRHLDIYLGSTRIVHRDLVETAPNHTPFYSFYHPAMQETLIQAAAEAGAQVRRGTWVRHLQPGRPPRVVTEQGGRTEEFNARLIVAADGRASLARKWADFPVQRDPQRLLISGVLFETMPTGDDATTLFFNPGIGQSAYLFPQNHGHVRAYIVHQRKTNYRLHGDEAISRFVEESVKAGASRELYEGIKAIGPLATFDGADTWVAHPYKEGIALVGDAAASSDPAWGEGLSLTMRDVRVLRDKLLSTKDWHIAGHAYAEEHDRHYGIIHTLDNWFREFFLETGPAADARRARAFPLIAQEATRIPDLFGLGPDMPVNETIRRRFFGEE